MHASFDLDQLTSNGGLLWLAETDEQLGLTSVMAGTISNWRRGRMRHSLAPLVRQRVSKIACGYPDRNDATTLRHGPLVKLSCGR